jgi:hypothetical protein
MLRSRKVQRSASYVVWATPAHREKPRAVGHEIRPGCLKIVAYTESKPIADALAIGDWLIRDGDRESDMKR